MVAVLCRRLLTEGGNKLRWRTPRTATINDTRRLITVSHLKRECIERRKGNITVYLKHTDQYVYGEKKSTH